MAIANQLETNRDQLTFDLLRSASLSSFVRAARSSSRL